jgi:hypothetical protein
VRPAVAAIAVAVLLFAYGGIAGGNPAAAPGADTGAVRCADDNVSVRSPSAADARAACEGARDAIEFLSAQGFETALPVRIDVVAEMPDAVRRTTVGCYLETEQRVVVLTFAEFRKIRSWMGHPADRRTYRSVMAHEVAHAIAACNFKVQSATIQAKEYIAYVVTIATMDPGRRKALLARHPMEGFEGDWQMNTLIYLLDPHGFGVRAYRHYLQPGNGSNFLRAILQGEVMRDE